MKPVVIIAITFVLLVPISVFANFSEEMNGSICMEGTVFYEGQCWAEHLVPKEKTISDNICGTGTIKKDSICIPDPNYISPETKLKMKDLLFLQMCTAWDEELMDLKEFGYGKSNEVLVDLTTEEIIEYIENEKERLGCDDFQKKPSLGGGCLIATATFDSELSPQVQKLREIRDSKLLQTESGTQFMGMFNSFYYSFSPIIADYERENPVFKEMVKMGVTPLLTTLSLMDYAESESEVLGIGIGVILLNLGMYVGVPVFAIMRIRK